MFGTFSSSKTTDSELGTWGVPFDNRDMKGILHDTSLLHFARSSSLLEILFHDPQCLRMVWTRKLE